jgi:hypothetical protein
LSIANCRLGIAGRQLNNSVIDVSMMVEQYKLPKGNQLGNGQSAIGNQQSN